MEEYWDDEDKEDTSIGLESKGKNYVVESLLYASVMITERQI